MLTDAKLDFWITNNLNVLLIGRHGVGKTARIISAFNRNNVKWIYFSAATLDPWVDFVGVPKEAKDDTGNPYLDLVRPKWFAEDSVEAIFLDEYNRAPQKVRNATMELLQFKSINGKKFKNLKIVWAAINPEKEDADDNAQPEYDVDKIDPAQRDRFEIQITVPYKPDMGYFRQKYGETMGSAAVQWWHELTSAEKDMVSPRRLDYAVDLFRKNGDVRDCLPEKISVQKFTSELTNGSYRSQMEKIVTAKSATDAAKFISDENAYNSTIKFILQKREYMDMFFPALSEERQANLIKKEPSAQNYAFDNLPSYSKILHNLATNDAKVAAKLQKAIRATAAASVNSTDVTQYTFSKKYAPLQPRPGSVALNGANLMSMMSSYSFFLTRGTHYRIKLYDSMVHGLTAIPVSTLGDKELLSIAQYFYAMIDSTQDYTTMESFYSFSDTFGFVHAELKRRNLIPYTSLSTKVTTYIRHNIAKFL